MKGDHSGFKQNQESNNSTSQINKPQNKIDYNTAGSTLVKTVNFIQTTSNAHKRPESSTANSVIKNYRDGQLNSERYYNNEGRPYLDIDYTDHGNSKTHPYVPHQHKISFINGKLKREKADGRIK